MCSFYDNIPTSKENFISRRFIAMKKSKKKIEKAVAKLAYISAKNSANSTCYAWFGQPKMPSIVKKMRKF